MRPSHAMQLQQLRQTPCTCRNRNPEECQARAVVLNYFLSQQFPSSVYSFILLTPNTHRSSTRVTTYSSVRLLVPTRLSGPIWHLAPLFESHRCKGKYRCFMLWSCFSFCHNCMMFFPCDVQCCERAFIFPWTIKLICKCIKT